MVLIRGMKLLAGGLLAASVSLAQAQSLKDQAVQGALGDTLSTVAGLALGAVELNPLGPVVAIGMKAVTMRYAESLPDTERPVFYAAAAAWWQGAAVNNVCVAAALATGGSFSPVCIALGIAWGMRTWKESEDERLFWEGCAMLRQYAEAPQLECIYTPLRERLALAASPQGGAVPGASPLP